MARNSLGVLLVNKAQFPVPEAGIPVLLSRRQARLKFRPEELSMVIVTCTVAPSRTVKVRRSESSTLLILPVIVVQPTGVLSHIVPWVSRCR